MKNIIFVLFVLYSYNYAQLVEEHVIDLANQVPGSEVIKTFSNNDELNLRIIYINALPDTKYTYEVKQRKIEFAPLKAPGNFKTLSKLDQQCTKILKGMMAEIENCKDEKEIKNTIKKILDLKDTTCIPGQKEAYHNEAKKLTTRDPIYFESLQPGRELRINFYRMVKDSMITWTNIYINEVEDNWFFTYGFSFLRLNHQGNEFYSKENDVESNYVITKKEMRKRWEYVPSIFYHWQPNGDLWDYFGFSLTGGLGFDLTSPIVFLGLSMIYKHNLILSFGGGFHQVKDLLGAYKENDIIKENLEPNQLVESKYVWNPSFTISFRFDKYPFSK